MPIQTLLSLILIAGTAFCAQAISPHLNDPYYSAVLLDAHTGSVLWEDHAGAEAYPASMIKIMNAFVVFDALDQGTISLDTPVEVTREIANIGGRQVWLKQGEIFPVEELLFAMLVHSANDAATALAYAVSGSPDAHAEKMNLKARELELTRTFFHNVHGLPPAPGDLPDVSCALDMARLGIALIEAHPQIFKYTSLPFRDFREGTPVNMASSNKLLRSFDGCDGLKTGYFRAGGFSITATALRADQRIIAVVMGCRSKKVRNMWAARLLERGFVLTQEREKSGSAD